MGYGGSPSQFPPFYNVVNIKVALIQLSDIHFSSKRDLICSRHEAFCRSCKYLINECSKVIFVISGDIADKIGSPAAKIITFTIKTIYGKMRLAELQDIVNEYKDNPVVLEIIKARVISYVYNNYVDFSTRQKIGQLCKLRLVDNTGINQKKLYNRD